jgi:hypothetical protein
LDIEEKFVFFEKCKFPFPMRHGHSGCLAETSRHAALKGASIEFEKMEGYHSRSRYQYDVPGDVVRYN